MTGTMSWKTLSADHRVRSLAEIEAGKHIIGAYIGQRSGPTLVAIGSVHGNEPAGAAALVRIAAWLEENRPKINGRIYLLAGNTRAIARRVRYIDADLNRHWTNRNLSGAVTARPDDVVEDKELSELQAILDQILVTAEDEVHVLDLHSTSAEGQPFATVGDTLRNRTFARKLPVTILLGIEEQLDGTMLEYLNNMGAVTLGFEGGQHDSDETVGNHESLVMLGLVNAGILAAADVPNRPLYRAGLAQRTGGSAIYEVRYRHAISEIDQFEMDAGFNNFDPVSAGQRLACDSQGIVTAQECGVVLMPLYQKLGEDGFFIGRRIAAFWLWLSAILRRLGVPSLMPLLPGVSRDKDDLYTLTVNTRVARVFPVQIFHLLGFRKRRWSEGELVVSRRKHDTSSPFRERSDKAHGR